VIVGFVSDAHGNAAGLARCLEALDDAGATSYYFLGDSVGYMPDEERVLALLESRGALCIRGNHEQMLLGELPLPEARDRAYRVAEARARLAPRWRDWIATWPIRREVTIAGARLLLVHGSPRDPLEGYVYPDADLAPFRDLPYDLVLMGHTHRPFVAQAGAVQVINVGSCGLPRDAGHLASCALYQADTRTCEILRVEFDAAGVVASLGDRIDPSVAACLQRKGPTLGRVIRS
jgi:predicted phosphodiesterase